MTWTDDHGEDGLRRKFDVHKTAWNLTPQGAYDQYEPDTRIGADGEFVFVLRPETDAEAWVAMEAYAILVKDRAPQLAADIRAELHRFRVANERTTP